jgi:hypothetical protein
MPGFDQQQASLPAQAYNEQMLANYANSIARMVQDQNALLADQLRRFYKKPSIFKGLNQFSYLGLYAPPDPGSPFCEYLQTTLGNLPAIYVFNIEDATEIDVAMVLSSINATTFPDYLFAALTPLSQSVQINLSDFFQVPLISTTQDATTGTTNGSTATFFQTIPCDGNRFLHLSSFSLEYISNQDGPVVPADQQGVLSISLKK